MRGERCHVSRVDPDLSMAVVAGGRIERPFPTVEIGVLPLDYPALLDRLSHPCCSL